MAELMLSPVGLSAVDKLSPPAQCQLADRWGLVPLFRGCQNFSAAFGPVTEVRESGGQLTDVAASPPRQPMSVYVRSLYRIGIAVV